MNIEIKKKKNYYEYTVWYGKHYLGDIGRREGKNKFCFFPDDCGMIGNMWLYEDCLRQIADSIKLLNDMKLGNNE